MGVELERFEMTAPDDARSLRAALDRCSARTADKVAIVAKTEGTATVNDFGRSLALRAIREALSEAGVCADAQIIVSMGSEGVITPGGYLLVERRADSRGIPGLALGNGRSDKLSSADLVNRRHIEAMRQAVANGIEDAGLQRREVALVLAKTPLLTREMAADLPARQKEAGNSSSLSRAAAALGIAVALGEVDDPGEEAIGRRHDLFCRRAMVFSGTETDRCEVVVLGNRPDQPTAIRSGIIDDLIDIDGMARIVSGQADGTIEQARRIAGSGRIVASFLKAGVAPDGRIRGHRTTVFSSDLDPDKHMRAAASGVLGALLGDTRSFVSGGAEHQAPPGGGVFAVILKS
jgi:cyanuric acid amidohydrolase